MTVERSRVREVRLTVDGIEVDHLTTRHARVDGVWRFVSATLSGRARLDPLRREIVIRRAADLSPALALIVASMEPTG